MKLLKLRQIIKFASCPAALDLSLCRLSINNTIDAFCLSAHDSNSHRILAHFYRQLSVYNQWNRLYFSIVLRKLFCLRGFQMQSASVESVFDMANWKQDCWRQTSLWLYQNRTVGGCFLSQSQRVLAQTVHAFYCMPIFRALLRIPYINDPISYVYAQDIYIYM